MLVFLMNANDDNGAWPQSSSHLISVTICMSTHRAHDPDHALLRHTTTHCWIVHYAEDSWWCDKRTDELWFNEDIKGTITTEDRLVWRKMELRKQQQKKQTLPQPPHTLIISHNINKQHFSPVFYRTHSPSRASSGALLQLMVPVMGS